MFFPAWNLGFLTKLFAL